MEKALAHYILIIAYYTYATLCERTDMVLKRIVITEDFDGFFQL